MGNYLNPFRRFQLIFIATRHDYRSPIPTARRFIIQTAFRGQINEFEGTEEYFHTTRRLTSLPRNMHTPITHNIRPFEARVRRDSISAVTPIPPWTYVVRRRCRVLARLLAPRSHCGAIKQRYSTLYIIHEKYRTT